MGKAALKWLTAFARLLCVMGTKGCASTLNYVKFELSVLLLITPDVTVCLTVIGACSLSLCWFI